MRNHLFLSKPSHPYPLMLRILLAVVASLLLLQSTLFTSAHAETFELPLRSQSLEQGFHALPNAELLERANTLYRQGLNPFNAEQRLLRQREVLYQQIEREHSDWQPPEPLELDTLEGEALLTAAQQRMEQYQRRQEILARQQQAFEHYLRQQEVAQQATEGFLSTLRELYVMVLELQLRIEDGSLEQEALPEQLTVQAVEQRVTALRERRQSLLEKQEASREQQQALQEEMQEIEAELAAAQTQLAEERREQEAKTQRQRLEEQYQQQEDQQVPAAFAELEDERIILQGDFHILQLRFNRRYTQLDALEAALQEELEAVPSPGLGLSVAELEQQIALLEAFIQQLRERSEALQPFQKRQEEVAELGEGFQIAATFLREQLAEMELLIQIASEREIALQQRLDLAFIQQQREAIRESMRDADAKLQALEAQRTSLQARLEEMNALRQQAQRTLEDLQQTLASSQQALQWEEQLGELDNETLVAHFVGDAEQIEEQRQALDEQSQTVAKHKDEEALLRDQRNNLRDPLLRGTAAVAIQEERQRIQRRIYEFAGMETPERPATSSPEAGSEPAVEAAATQQAAPTAAAAPAPRFSDDTEGLRRYQGLLASRQHYLRSRQQSREQLAAQLQRLEEAQSQHIQMLSNLHQLSLQQYATALEVKKRLGRGDLLPEQAPEGVASALVRALRREPITALEQALSERINQRAHTRLQIAHLGIDESLPEEEGEAVAAAADPEASAEASTEASAEEEGALLSALEKQYEMFGSLVNVAGQRLDLLADLQRLESERLQQEETLVGSERLDQQAERRMRSGSGWLESLLSLLPSGRAAELSELLRSNYRSLIVLEAQQAVLTVEREKMAELLQLVQQDRQTLNEMLPALHEKLAALEGEYDATFMTARIQLQPEEATQLRADFAARSGHSIAPAPPLLEQDKEGFVQRMQEELLVLHVQVVALREWIALFEQHQQTTLQSELARYQDQSGQLNALDASFMRTVKRLTGHPAEEMAQLPERQQPTTHLEKTYFLNGEIGADHEQRTQALLRALLRFVIELLVIIYLAWFLVIMARRWVHRKSQEIEMIAGPDSTHQLFALSFGFVAFRIIVLAAAITLVLSRMGFEIGVIIASLGIFGVALALAAKTTLSDMLGGITLFVEHSFSIGDVIQISSADPQMGAAELGRVEAVSWRVTRIVNVMNYSITIPNSRVSESVIINYTRQKNLRDFTHIFVSPAYDTRQVVALISEAVDECNLIRQDLQKQVLATGNVVVDRLLVSRYEIRWYTDIPYLARGRVLTELWTRVWKKFDDAGLSLEYKPKSE